MRMIMIGGSGFIGTAFIEYAASMDREIICCDYCLPHKQYSTLRYILMQNESLAFYRELLQKDDVVFILKWKGVPAMCLENGRELIENNIVGTMTLVEACVEKQVKKIIFASSGGAVYGNTESLPIKEEVPANPISLYAIQKLMVEEYLQYISRTEGINTIILRISNPYGPGQKPFGGQGIIATFMASVIMDKPVEIWGDGNCVRDYVYIDDLSRCIAICMEKDMESGIYNVGSSKGISIFEICHEIEAITKKSVNYIVKEAGKNQVRDNILECSKIYDAIGWKYSVEMQEGLERIYAEWKRNMMDDRWRRD